MNMQDLELHIADRLTTTLRRYPQLRDLVSFLNGQNDVYVFGGWVRDVTHAFVHGERVAWSDIDLVVDGQVVQDQLAGVTRSPLGGYEIHISPRKTADFWSLNESYVFTNDLFRPSITNLLKSTVFTINSVVYDLRSHRLRDYLAVRDIGRRSIRFNCRRYLDSFPELQVWRAMKLQNKLNYEIDDGVRQFVAGVLKTRSPAEFLKKLHWHNERIGLREVKSLYSHWLSLDR